MSTGRRWLRKDYVPTCLTGNGEMVRCGGRTMWMNCSDSGLVWIVEGCFCDDEQVKNTRFSSLDSRQSMTSNDHNPSRLLLSNYTEDGLVIQFREIEMMHAHVSVRFTDHPTKMTVRLVSSDIFSFR